jgi:hypothetical protein
VRARVSKASRVRPLRVRVQAASRNATRYSWSHFRTHSGRVQAASRRRPDGEKPLLATPNPPRDTAFLPRSPRETPPYLLSPRLSVCVKNGQGKEGGFYRFYKYAPGGPRGVSKGLDFTSRGALLVEPARPRRALAYQGVKSCPPPPLPPPPLHKRQLGIRGGVGVSVLVSCRLAQAVVVCL